MILVTGGAGFIGSNFVLRWLAMEQEPIIVVDKLTYAGNINNLASIGTDPRYVFVRGDINDAALIPSLLLQYRPRAILNFAAESHVDRSIHDPSEFIRTNINGVFNLLEAARHYWTEILQSESLNFRFLQVSTDEVYGALNPSEPPFSETTAYAPNSPYAASKAAADHLVRAYHQTYGLPTLTTNCSNNYGPYQFPEKLIPLTILHALEGKPLPLYGDGLQVRDWLYVTDHCSALQQVLAKGQVGHTYNIGTNCEKTNKEVMQTICKILDELRPRANGQSYQSLITQVKDRLGHDKRYAINATKIKQELGWLPDTTFEIGLRETIEWYLTHAEWVEAIKGGHYAQWLCSHYQQKCVI